MPQAYLDCIKNGGRVRSKRIDKTHYMPICFKDGKSFAGETKQYKKILKGKKK